MSSHPLRAAGVLTAVAALILSGSALAASSRDRYVRHHLSFTQQGAFVEGNQEGLSVNFVTPGSWSRLKQTRKSHISFRAGTSCRYSITLTTRLAEDSDETPAEHVAAALPVPTTSYLLDGGVRNSTGAWRVTRQANAVDRRAGRVRLLAMRADRRSLGGRRAWQETIVSAISRAADECHTGTYRDALGPQIGDALATSTGRAYSFAPRKR